MTNQDKKNFLKRLGTVKVDRFKLICKNIENSFQISRLFCSLHKFDCALKSLNTAKLWTDR